MTVNDGNGLFDSGGLIDTLIVDCNSLTQALAAGEYVRYCAKIVEMVQKLDRLKEGMAADLADRDKTIRELREALNPGEGEDGNV